jgi:hypothetical protein
MGAKKLGKAVFSPSFCPHLSASERFKSSLSGSNRELLITLTVDRESNGNEVDRGTITASKKQ